MSNIALASAAVAVGTLSAGALAGTPAAFTEEAVARGIDYYALERTSLLRFGYGLAFADLDLDGDNDVVCLGNVGNTVGVFENDGTGQFTDRSATSGLPLVLGRSGVVAFDYDDDGDLDLFISQIDHANVLARNDGNFTFTDVSAAAGVNLTSRGTGPSVGDYDGDGWLDLHVPNYDFPDFLFHNNGDGTFTEVAAAMGVADPWRGWQSVFFDMDVDGDMDLYVSNDKKIYTETTMHNRLYENVGGALIDVSSGSGTDVNIYSMGVAVGDFDGDLDTDLYCTNLAVEPNVLLLNQGPGTYVEAQAAAGVSSNRTGWGAIFADVDHDTRADLYVCDMADPIAGALGSRNRLYVHGGAWPCVDVAPSLAVDDAEDSFGVAGGDADGDGDVDLLVQSNDARIRLYINHAGDDGAWIRLRVNGIAPNRQAIGAHVAARTGSTWQVRQIVAGGNGFRGQNELDVHFGLGAETVVDEVVVRWPGGLERSFGPLAANATWTIDPPSNPADLDGDDAVAVSDLVALILAWGPCPAFPAGCPADIDGSGAVDVGDLVTLILSWGG